MKPATALLGATLFCLPACGGNHKPGATDTAPRAEERVVPRQVQETAPATSALAPQRKRVSPRPILDVLPGDRSMIVHLNWRTLEASDFFQAHRDALLASLNEPIAFVRDRCALEPIQELESLTIALGPEPLGGKDMLVAATLRIGRAAVESCVAKAGGTVQEGKYLVDGKTLHVYWPSERTLLLSESMSAADMRAALGKGRASNNELVMQFLRKTDSHAAVWGGGAIPDSVSALAGGGFAMPHGFFFNMNAWSGIDGAMNLLFKSEEDATATLTMLQMGINMMGSQMPGGTELRNAIQMERQGNHIKIDAVIPAEDVARLVAGTPSP